MSIQFPASKACVTTWRKPRRRWTGKKYIQAAAGHPERLRDWLTEPAETATKHAWSGVVHPKQARAQYQALREQVQTLAREQRIRDFSSKQIGLDPMPELPIHALEVPLTPVMPIVLPSNCCLLPVRFTLPT